MKLSERITEEGVWRQIDDADTMWKVTADYIRRSAKKVLGTSRRGGNKMKGVWWWNEEVKEKVREKKEAYADFMNSGADEKRRLYHRLATKKGEKEVFKLTRAKERRTRDLGVVRCIKDENSKVLSEDAEIRER